MKVEGLHVEDLLDDEPQAFQESQNSEATCAVDASTATMAADNTQCVDTDELTRIVRHKVIVLSPANVGLRVDSSRDSSPTDAGDHFCWDESYSPLSIKEEIECPENASNRNEDLSFSSTEVEVLESCCTEKVCVAQHDTWSYSPFNTVRPKGPAIEFIPEAAESIIDVSETPQPSTSAMDTWMIEMGMAPYFCKFCFNQFFCKAKLTAHYIETHPRNYTFQSTSP